MATRRSTAATRAVDRQVPGTPNTSNEAFFDAMLRHQIGLLRMSKGLGRRVRELLDASEADLRAAIRNRLRGQTGLTTSANVQRLQRLLEEIRKIRGQAHRDVAALFQKELRKLAAAEAAFIDGIFKTVIPVRVSTTLPAPELLRSIVTVRPFEGKILREWAQDIRRADIARIEAQIRIGLVQGESIPDIARRITGTVRLRGQDGVTQITRRDAEGLARTATNAIANQSRREYFKENAEFFDQELYVATLDAATTPICRSLDGTRFPIDEGRFPPLHFRCRSLRVAILDADPLGRRPSKPVHEKRLLREFAEAEGIEPVPRSRKDLPRGTKGSFDAFSRTRTRELIGRVPAKVDYQTWLGRQSAAFQDDVLGKTKGALFRRGGLTLDRFVDANDLEKTLDELARSDADAFVAAGFDPEDFLIPQPRAA